MIIKVNIGRRAGELVEYPHHIAQALLADGRASRPDESPAIVAEEVKPQPSTRKKR
jgi:hypothetical protein